MVKKNGLPWMWSKNSIEEDTMKEVMVNASTSYPICIGRRLLPQVGEEIRKRVEPCKAAVITDSNVFGLYEKEVRESLKKAGFSVCSYTFTARIIKSFLSSRRHFVSKKRCSRNSQVEKSACVRLISFDWHI